MLLYKQALTLNPSPSAGRHPAGRPAAGRPVARGPAHGGDADGPTDGCDADSLLMP